MFLCEANGLFNRVQAKNSWKKICSSFSDRNKLEFWDGRSCFTNRMGANFFSVKVITTYYHIFLFLRLQLRILYYAISVDISFYSTCMSSTTMLYFVKGMLIHDWILNIYIHSNLVIIHKSGLIFGDNIQGGL
jgi:hypothetical protein